MSDSKTVGMGIRLAEHQRSELEGIAAETGTEVSQLIRLAVTALLQHHERCGGRLVLPIDFSEMPAGRKISCTSAFSLPCSQSGAL